MAEAKITITGNLTADPELRYVGDNAVAQFSVASTASKKVGDEWVDEETVFLRVSAWRQLGEGAAETLRKGDSVIVTGKLKQRSFEKDGQKRSVFEIDADNIGKSVRARKDGGKSSYEKAAEQTPGW